jgi:hypothetical protein
MRAVLDQMPRHIQRNGGWGFPHKDTGPYLWGRVFGRNGNLCGAHGMHQLGDYTTAYPVRYWEKQYFNEPDVYRRLTADSYMVHRFAHSWANMDDVAVTMAEVT